MSIENCLDEEPVNSRRTIASLIVTATVLYFWLAHEAEVHHSLSPFDLQTFRISGAIFATSLVVAGVVPRGLFSKHPVANGPLAALALILIVIAARVGVSVAIHDFDIKRTSVADVGRLAWYSSIQGFTVFFALAPLAFLVIETRDRAKRSQALRNRVGTRPPNLEPKKRNCFNNEQDKEWSEEGQPPPRLVIWVAVIFVVLLICHGSEGARTGKSRRQHH